MTDRGEQVVADQVLLATDPFSALEVAGRDAVGPEAADRLAERDLPGASLKVSVALDRLPVFPCLPEDRGQLGATIHVLPEEGEATAALEAAHRAAVAGDLPETPSIDLFIQTVADPGLRGGGSRHAAGLFVQWVPAEPRAGTWDERLPAFERRLFELVDEVAPASPRRSSRR